MRERGGGEREREREGEREKEIPGCTKSVWGAAYIQWQSWP